jgi:putative ABC transport system substrate-binding protein
VKRREAIVGMAALAIASVAAFAQQKVWRVGFLMQSSRPASLDADSLGGFLRGMRELGYVEGRNLVIEWRFADHNADRMPGLAAELVGLKPDVIVAQGNLSTHAAQKATTSIPIVMQGAADPVATGFVKSLARPEANITGVANLASEYGPKQLQLLHEIVPKASRVAVLMNPDNPASASFLRNIHDAARLSGKSIVPVDARNSLEIAASFTRMTQERTDALIVVGDPFLANQGRLIAELALKHRLPCIGPFRSQSKAGMLASFGADITENFRRAADYVDKILKGAKPGDLPVEQPTKFNLAINLRTAKALGITIPKPVLLRADEVIQ